MPKTQIVEQSSSIEDLGRQVNDAEQALDELKQRQATFPTEYRAHLEAGRMAEAVGLKRQHSGVDDEAFAAECTLLERRAELADARTEQARQRLTATELDGAIGEAQQQLQEAQAHLAALLNQHRMVRIQARDYQAEASELRQQRDRLIGQKARAASSPVVRSAWQAQAGVR